MLFSKIFGFLFKSKEPCPVTPTKRILFIVKKRTLPSYNHKGTQPSTGLLNSAHYVVDAINNNNLAVAGLVEVIDNNCIDREVTAFNPDIVIIEALWVVPEKFDVLKRLHPNVKWIVRLHSDIPFLAHEGVAFEWMQKYLERDVDVAVNNPRIFSELGFVFPSEKLHYLPNCYTLPAKNPTTCLEHKPVINIICAGAVRPMKNHLIQALTAIEFANKYDLALNFHINGSRCEDKGDGVLRNLRSLFEPLRYHTLIEHPWMDQDDFKELLQSMDISMQVSMSETFNIVTADAVSVGVPVVVSPEISWVNQKFQAYPTSSASILVALENAYLLGHMGKHKCNFTNLQKYNADSVVEWKKLVK